MIYPILISLSSLFPLEASDYRRFEDNFQAMQEDGYDYRWNLEISTLELRQTPRSKRLERQRYGTVIEQRQVVTLAATKKLTFDSYDDESYEDSFTIRKERNLRVSLVGCVFEASTMILGSIPNTPDDSFSDFERTLDSFWLAELKNTASIRDLYPSAEISYEPVTRYESTKVGEIDFIDLCS